MPWGLMSKPPAGTEGPSKLWITAGSWSCSQIAPCCSIPASLKGKKSMRLLYNS